MRTLKGVPVLSSSVPAPGGGIFVSVPDYDSGFDGGEFLAKAFTEKHPDVKPYLIIGTYPDGGEGSMQRLKGVTEGIQSVIPDIPKDQIIEIDTKADPVGTREKALAVISKIPEDAYIVSSAINDDTAFAIFQALKQRGRQDKSFVLGIGGVNPDGLRYVCKYPQFVGTVSHLPDRWGNYLVPAVMAMIRGEEIPPALDIPYKILTRENMREAYPDAPC
jgi:ABC-type sugar transport system substrate-binding protein